MFLDLENLDVLLKETDYRSLSGLSLAFIGDAVYELLIRKYILSKGEARVKEMHKDCVRLVNADFQANTMDILLPLLSEEEISVFKRGRNAHSAHTPKNKSEAQYHKSTGFEALIGFLYLKKDYGRLNYLFSLIIEQGEKYEQH
ncbi:MAG: ribonuclease III [Clostridia bacterium]|nr:ribonuclease III [Clostridia bacterium]